ncbi:MAG: xanthine dehydrogenase family protein molybdopterin-binding subunit [Pseudomonadota bacterium]
MNAPGRQDTFRSDFRVVGTSPVRPDGIDKVTGKALYGPDFVAPGMLAGAILRSPHPHARIRAIDTRAAEALAGVKAVVTGRDFPQASADEIAIGEAEGNAADLAHNCMAQGKVLYEGHAVAAVAATTREIAEAALRLIVVDYELLPHVTGLEEALLPGAPVLHEGLLTKGCKPAEAKPNAAARQALNRGDPAAALAGAAKVVSRRFVTAPVHQGYIEPHACVALWNTDGQAQIWASSQGHFMIRELTAAILQIPQANIRVTPLEIGGGFGGKTKVYLEPVAMLLSRKAGRPVRLTMSRGEVFRATGPAPGSIIDIRLGAQADGTLAGVEMEFWYNCGAFPGGDALYGVTMAVGHYRLADADITGWDVLSNMPSTAAYRAPGAPQTTFAVESCIDELAQQLGLDPLEMRLKNAVRQGDPGLFGLPHGNVGYIECLEAAKAHPHWTAPLKPGEGRGIAGGLWMNYGGPSTAQVSVADDGSVLVTEGSPDIGGSRASMAIMAAETLGLPYDKVRVTIADTSSIGYSMVTGGSRTTFATGRAVIAAAEGALAELVKRAALIWGVEADEVAWQDGMARCSTGDHAGETLTLAAIAAQAGVTGGPISAEASLNAQGWLPGFAVHICDTAVDTETGHVAITRYTAVQDVGRAIHRDYVEGQLQGGATQGIGWALNEAYLWNAAGLMDNAGFLDYRVPVASDLPMIDTVLVEVPNPHHPYGVKGVGEAPIVPPLAAVANSVSRATGVRMQQLPLAPDRVFAAVNAARG